MKMSNGLAEICGIHSGDGYLRNDGIRREWDISGSVEEKDYYDNHVIPLFNKVFNLKIKGKFFHSRNTYGFVIRDKEIIEYAHNSLGFPYGRKSLKIKVPKLVFEKSEFICKCLRGYFDTDGCLTFGKKYGNYKEFKRNMHCYPIIVISTVSMGLSEDMHNIFKKLNLNFVFYKYKPKKETESLKYIFRLNGVNNINTWMKEIGTKNPIQYSRFLVWKKYGFCPPKTTYSQRLKMLGDLIEPSTYYRGL